jgi:hypothetical protein
MIASGYIWVFVDLSARAPQVVPEKYQQAIIYSICILN